MCITSCIVYSLLSSEKVFRDNDFDIITSYMDNGLSIVLIKDFRPSLFVHGGLGCGLI